MAKDPFSAALAGFRRWAKTTERELAGDPGADAAELQTLLDLMRDYLDIERPADLSQGDVEELLLRVYPRKITVLDPADIEDTIPAMRDFLAYLADTGAMPEGRARAFERGLDRIAPRFAKAVMDPSNWGMARSFVQAMAADGVDVTDQAAMTSWIASYNERLSLEDGGPDAADEYPYDGDDIDDIDFKQAFGLPDRMPPMRLPSAAELAVPARGAPLIGQLLALAGWLGTGRAVTENAELTGGDATEAAVALGVGVPPVTDAQALPGTAEPPAVRMRDIPRLDYLWRLALDAGFIALDGDETLAIPGEVAQAWADASDHQVLDVWKTVFALVLATTLDLAASRDPRRSRELDFFGHGGGLAVMLFSAKAEGLPVAEASEVIKSASVAELAPARAEKAWQSWIRAHGDPARLLLDELAELGAVRVSDGDDGELAWLTPLGLDAIRTQYVESGVEIPLLPPADQMSAADLIAMADGVGGDEFKAETAAWLAHRTPESAARDLLAVAADSDPASRVLVVAVVTDIGAPAEPAWRDVLGRPELRGYAKAALAALAVPAASASVAPVSDMSPGLELAEDDLAWMLTDGLVVNGWDEWDDDAERGSADLAARLREVIPPGREDAAFEMMARVPHPAAASVLTVIGRHHPDKKIAKAARKSAYKAGSRQVAQHR